MRPQDGEAVSLRDFCGVGYGAGGATDVTGFTFVGVGNKFRKLGGELIAHLNPSGRAQPEPAAGEVAAIHVGTRL